MDINTKDTSGVFNLDNLPQDLWPMIINFMNDKTKRQMRATNKKWLNYIKYNNFVLYYTNKEDLETIVEYLSRYSWPIELTFQKHRFMGLQDITNQLYKLTNLTKMNDSPSWKNFDPIAEREWLRLTTLTNIEHWGFQRHSIPLNLLRHFTKLTKWDFYGDEEDIISILKRMANLNSLTYTKKSLPLMHLSHPSKLTYLDISVYPDMAQHSQHWSVLTNLRELLAYYPETHNNYNSNINIIDLSYLTALESCKLSGRESAQSFSMLTNLTRLEIATDRWTLETALSLNKSKHMKVLKVHPDINQFNNVLADLDQLRTLSLVRAAKVSSSIASLTSLTNLESLELSKCALKDFSCLTQLTNLKSLTTDGPIDGIEYCIGRFTLLEHLGMTRPYKGGFSADFSDLTNLTSLQLFNIQQPNGLQYLTQLVSLQLQIINNMHNYDFLSDLQAITMLQIESFQPEAKESLWSNLPLLTNIQALDAYFDNDEQLLQLVPMTNLTAITIREIYGEQRVRGVHLTALTSLKNIMFLS